MTDEDDDYKPRAAHEFPDWELEEMIRMAVDQVLRPDIAKRALEWLDRKLGTKH